MVATSLASMLLHIWSFFAMKSFHRWFLVALFCILKLPGAFAAPVINASKDDNTAAGVRKQVGNQITYTINISNTGDVAATNVTFTDATPTNTTDVAGGLSATPVAVDDTYPSTILANTSVNTANSSGFSVVANDSLGYAGGNAVTASGVTVTANSPAHGTVSMVSSGANVGTFTYTPTPGYTGTDSFTYTISNGVAGGTTASITGTVNLVVGGPVIWFVDPNVGATGSGRLGSPFKTLAEAITAIGANSNQRIFLYTSATAQSGNFILKSGGWLVGQGAIGTNFDTVMGITPPADTAARPSINNATKPTITNAAGNTISLGEGNSIFGVALNNTGGGFALLGSSINAGTIGNPTTADVTLGSSGTSSGALSLTSGSGAFNINAPITTTVGRSVAIASRSGGTVAISSAISDTASGISLTNNSGATINFTGGLSLNTAANTAFNATGGGTVNVTQNNSTIVNTITTTTPTVALNIANTTIGASGITFRSVTAGNGADSAGTGIILDNTGSTAGLTVSGNGSAGSGGTIQHKNGADIHSVNTDGTFNITGTTGVGIFLRSTKNPSFAWMQLNDFSNLAVLGSSVTGLTIDHIVTSGVNGSNPNVNEAVMHFDNLSGSASVTNSTIQGGISDNFSLINNTGTLDRITFNTVTFGPMDSGNTNGDDSLFIEARNSATIKVTIQSSSFSSARGDIFQFDLTDSAVGDVVFKSNTVNNQHPFVSVGGGGLTLSGGGSVGANPTMTYDIGGATAAEGNTFRGARGDALLIVFQTGNGSATGKIRNNTFGVAAVDQSGAREASDIEIRTVGRGAQTTVIDSNQVYQYGNNGIYIQMGDMSVVGTGGTVGALNATISNNTVSNFSTNPATKSGIHVNLGTTTGDTYQACVDMLNNNAPNSGSTDTSAGSDLIVRQRQSTTMRLPNYGGTSSDTAAVAAYIKGRNTNGASSSVFAATPSGGGGYTGGAGSCTQPPLLFAPGGVEAVAVPCSLGKPAQGMVRSETARVEPAKVGRPEVSLSQAKLDSLVAVALERWSATGLTSDQVARLRRMKFEVAKLPGLRVGEADGDQIRVDENAGGNGWFIGADEKLFERHSSGARSYCEPASAPAGHLDLLTTIMHEMGHALGLEDVYAAQDRDNLMYGYLTKGERRGPIRNQASGLRPNESLSPHFLSAPLNIGTLPAGKSVVITYSVSITSAATSISNQGTVSGANFANKLTDDPQAGGSSDPTVTPVELPPTVSNIGKTINEDAALSFVATDFTAAYADPNGDALSSVRILSLPTNGTLKVGSVNAVVNQNVAFGSLDTITYTPNVNYNGSDSFSWNASDGTLLAAAGATVNLTINAVNDAPTLNTINNPAAIPEDSGQQTVNLSGIASGPPNESSQTITVTASSGNTSVIPDPVVTYTSPGTTGSLSYTPVANASGSAVITVTVKDNGGTANGGVDTFQRTFTVVVNPVNDAPVITGQLPVSTAFNTPRTIMFSDLQVADVDNSYPTGFVLTAFSGTNYSLGGNTVTPALNFFGTLAVPVKVNDGLLDSNTYQLALTVNPDPAYAKSATAIQKDPGGFKISFIGNPGAQYTVQYADALPALPAAWHFISFQIANAQGTFSIIDNPPAGTTTRFYRAIIP